ARCCCTSGRSCSEAWIDFFESKTESAQSAPDRQRRDLHLQTIAQFGRTQIRMRPRQFCKLRQMRIEKGFGTGSIAARSNAARLTPTLLKPAHECLRHRILPGHFLSTQPSITVTQNPFAQID